MKPLFKNGEAEASMRAWFERFRARIGAPTEGRCVQTRFGRTHVLVGGPEEGPPLVLLHGALASSAHALRELAPLLHSFRVHAVDIVGQSPMSESSRPSVANDDYADWLVDVLDGLGLDRAHIVGVSWGGFVAIRLAAKAPGRIERMALLVPAGVVRGPFWAGMLKVGLPLTRYLLSPTPERRAAFLRHTLTTAEDDEWASYLGEAFLSYRLDMTVPPRARPEELAALEAPILVLAAEHDLSFPGRKLLERSKTLFPNLVAGELIQGSHHCPPTTDAFRAWLGDRLTDFLLGRERRATPWCPRASQGGAGPAQAPEPRPGPGPG